VHAGRIVALDTPAALLAQLGREIIELRVQDDPVAALASLRTSGVAGGDAFLIGSTLTIPLHDGSARDAVDKIDNAGVGTTSITTRAPTLDDVYLQLTGERLAA
jgi:ABC-2 type transport system ATP-binding protein